MRHRATNLLKIAARTLALGIGLVELCCCVPLRADNPLEAADIAQERQLYPPEIVREKALALVRYGNEAGQRKRLAMGITPIEIKLQQLDSVKALEHPSLEAQILNEHIQNEAILAPVQTVILYRPIGKTNVFVDLNQRVSPSQYIPQEQLVAGVWILRPLQKVTVPACLNLAETEEYVQLRYVQNCPKGSYWSHLGRPKADDSQLKTLRYFDYLDYYAPTRTIVIFTALEYRLQRRMR